MLLPPLVFGTLAAAAADAPLAAARKLLLTGKYAEAVEACQALRGDDPAVAIVLARAQEAQGKPAEAIATLAKPRSTAAIEAELARLEFDRGNYEAAQRHVDNALKAEATRPLARWIAAELDRTAGRVEAADKRCRALVRYYNDGDFDDAESLRWIGRAAAQNARWNRLSDQFDFLVNELFPAALKLDPDFWPAHFEAGRLFLEKYNQADATREFQLALRINPNAAEVHAALAAVALEGHNIEEAKRRLDRALELFPTLLEAWLLRADLHWANFHTDAALKILEEKALPLNPRDEATLGRMAACYLVLDGAKAEAPEGRFARLTADVLRENPKAGEFFFTVAELLETRNKQAQAEKYCLKAAELLPRQIGPQAELGLLYMRAGREAEAQRLLDEAFRADPFHVRVNNMLEVLDVLKPMGRRQTKRFVLRFDAERDRLLARYAAEHLEAVHPRLCKLFGYEPPAPSLFEVFSAAKGRSGHEWFSARMTGLPYVGTVAASTGRMVAMTSPGEMRGHSFNWARTLTHEYVHVITLQQTDFNIPHWYTEGLAVWCEDEPLPHEWTEVLTARMAENRLFTLDDINFGFQRPKSESDWTLAYCQAELYVELMLKLGGEDSLRQLLKAYADGQETPQAITSVFKMLQSEFEAKYKDYVRGQITACKLKRPSSRGFKQLIEAHNKQPDDADTAAELAAAYLSRGADKEARKLAEDVLGKTPNHPLATCVIARTKLRALAPKGRGEDAELTAEQLAPIIAMLEPCLDKDGPHATVLALLAGLRLKAKDYRGAAELYGLGRKFDPDNPLWLRSLARVYLAADEQQDLYTVLAELARRDVNDAGIRRQLARIAAGQKDFATAGRWAREVMEIDIMDAESHRLLGESLVHERKLDAAIVEFETAVELQADDSAARFGLADALLQTKQDDKARSALEELLKRSPDYPGAAELLKELKENGK